MNNSRNKYKLKEDLVGYKNKYFDKNNPFLYF